MRYAVMYVEDNDLPAGHDWALVRQGGETMLFLRRGCVTERTLEQAWQGWNLLVNETLEREQGIAAAL